MIMKSTVLRCLALLVVVGALAACQTTRGDNIMMSQKGAVELRAMQSRAFDTPDRYKTLRAIVATLQDLGYSVDKVETGAGTVSATKLTALRLTASVYPRGSTQTIVRANAMVKIEQQKVQNQVDDPAFYQQLFFEPLSKALFLTALQVEDADVPAEPVQKAQAN
jgi:outer membrane lipopolysaccharide assembly protein LptE/RlpB